MKKVVIKDTLTDEFYCVGMTELDRYGSPTCGPKDFPFWSKDIDDACDFGSAIFAEREMEMNDLTDGGTRKPSVMEMKHENTAQHFSNVEARGLFKDKFVISNSDGTIWTADKAELYSFHTPEYEGKAKHWPLLECRFPWVRGFGFKKVKFEGLEKTSYTRDQFSINFGRAFTTDPLHLHSKNIELIINQKINKMKTKLTVEILDKVAGLEQVAAMIAAHNSGKQEASLRDIEGYYKASIACYPITYQGITLAYPKPHVLDIINADGAKAVRIQENELLELKEVSE